MHKKKYGKMTLGAWLNSEIEQANCFVVAAFGVLASVFAIAVRIMVGSPYRTLLELGIEEISPPAWIMTLLWTMAFFINASGAGLVMSYKIGGCEAEKYRGCLYFVLLTVAELLWYPTLFGGQLVFLSVLESILILCLSIVVTLLFYRITKLAGMFFLLHDIWLIYMLIMNFAVLINC